VDSTFICWSNGNSTNRANIVVEYIGDMIRWLELYPSGKVDFVWL
jgi:hypothetical protein